MADGDVSDLLAQLAVLLPKASASTLASTEATIVDLDGQCQQLVACMTLEMLPTEVLARIISDTSDACGRKRWTSVGRCARTCTALRNASQTCWVQELFNLFPEHSLPIGGAWLSRMLADTATRPSDVFEGLDSALRQRVRHWSRGEVPLPRQTFAHTSCVWENVLYVFGGRHDSSHSNALDVLDLESTPLRWEHRPPTADTPRVRRQHTACVDSTGRMHVIGGGYMKRNEPSPSPSPLAARRSPLTTHYSPITNNPHPGILSGTASASTATTHTRTGSTRVRGTRRRRRRPTGGAWPIRASPCLDVGRASRWRGHWRANPTTRQRRPRR